ncbi:hypothetical protein MAR_034542 [Mya arenaria]|uniref:Carboxymuconolactone decarboxylase-like domain-containing protein n=1 Tax=Mya arenaria TaxID=6604 RepID=A0ABY7GC43_MYAAR|nr:hypothetical protein MAR_034510 [Mya arenaria]WAR32000.1 hypothetical protein MAR_034542 [Mya arenaria]
MEAAILDTGRSIQKTAFVAYGSLTMADKEMIVVVTSAENKCLYCIIAHSALHRIYSKQPELADQLSANWRTADIDNRQRAILEFALDLCHCRPLTEVYLVYFMECPDSVSKRYPSRKPDAA